MLKTNDTDLRIGTATYTGLTAEERRDAAELADTHDAARVHRWPQPGCPWCPPAPCRCGVADCPDVSAHRLTWAGSETTWREVAR